MNMNGKLTEFPPIRNSSKTFEHRNEQTMQNCWSCHWIVQRDPLTHEKFSEKHRAVFSCNGQEVGPALSAQHKTEQKSSISQVLNYVWIEKTWINPICK